MRRPYMASRMESTVGFEPEPSECSSSSDAVRSVVLLAITAAFVSPLFLMAMGFCRASASSRASKYPLPPGKIDSSSSSVSLSSS